MDADRIDEILHRRTGDGSVLRPVCSLIAVDMGDSHAPAIEIAAAFAPREGIRMGPYALILITKKEIGVEFIRRHSSILGSLVMVKQNSFEGPHGESILLHQVWQQDDHPFARSVAELVLLQAAENSRWSIFYPLRIGADDDVDVYAEYYLDGGGGDVFVITS